MKNIKLLLSVVAFCFALSTASAQKLFIGPEIGANLSPTFETGNQNNYIIGLNGGLRADYRLTEKVSLRSGIFYSRRSTAYDSLSVGSLTEELEFLTELLGDFGGLEENVNFDINRSHQGIVHAQFMQIPLEITLREGRVQFSLGGYAGYMIAAESREVINENTPILQVVDLEELGGGFGGIFGALLPPASDTRTETFTGKNGYRNFDYGVRAGIAYVTPDNLSFNLSYRHGLADYRTERPAESVFTPFKNITFTLAYTFGIEKKETTDEVFTP